MIPKIVHYCWFGKPIPSSHKRIIENWKQLLPEYEFYSWGNEHIKEYKIKFIEQAASKGHYAFVADYFRLRKVYEYGGLYLDTDMVLLSSLNNILDKEFVICSEVPGRISWGFFGSIPKNPFLKDCYQLYHVMEYDQFKPPVIPYLLNNITNDYISKDPIHRQNLTSEFFYPMPMESASSNYLEFIGSNTQGVHLWDFSWKSAKEERSKYKEIFYRIKTLAIDLMRFSYSPYYFKINIIRIIRLVNLNKIDKR